MPVHTAKAIVLFCLVIISFAKMCTQAPRKLNPHKIRRTNPHTRRTSHCCCYCFRGGGGSGAQKHTFLSTPSRNTALHYEGRSAIPWQDTKPQATYYRVGVAPRRQPCTRMFAKRQAGRLLTTGSIKRSSERYRASQHEARKQ